MTNIPSTLKIVTYDTSGTFALTVGNHFFETCARANKNTDPKFIANNGTLHLDLMFIQLTAAGRADESGTVLVEALLHRQINFAQVDNARIDGIHFIKRNHP